MIDNNLHILLLIILLASIISILLKDKQTFEHQTNLDNTSYRAVIHGEGQYIEPDYIDHKSQYYNTFHNFKIPPLKTNDNLLNWNNLLKNKTNWNRDRKEKDRKERDKKDITDKTHKKKIKDIIYKNNNKNCWFKNISLP